MKNNELESRTEGIQKEKGTADDLTEVKTTEKLWYYVDPAEKLPRAP